MYLSIYIYIYVYVCICIHLYIYIQFSNLSHLQAFFESFPFPKSPNEKLSLFAIQTSKYHQIASVSFSNSPRASFPGAIPHVFPRAVMWCPWSSWESNPPGSCRWSSYRSRWCSWNDLNIQAWDDPLSMLVPVELNRYVHYIALHYIGHRTYITLHRTYI